MSILKTIKSLIVSKKERTNTMAKTSTKKSAKAEQQTLEVNQEQKMNKRPGSLVTYVYGQLYRGYLESDKATKFKITNINVRRWNKILGWLKKEEYIVDFKLGDTIETACELEVEGFDGNNLIYVNYLKAIERNMQAEKENNVA